MYNFGESTPSRALQGLLLLRILRLRDQSLFMPGGGEWAFSIFFINFVWDSPLISVNKFRVPPITTDEKFQVPPRTFFRQLFFHNKYW